ncbi:MAG: hypothetical protein IJH83_02700 [Coriobacteriales bacterium]|nr:hypothetical protein [Coriobacteriales bacterium]
MKMGHRSGFELTVQQCWAVSTAGFICVAAIYLCQCILGYLAPLHWTDVAKILPLLLASVGTCRKSRNVVATGLGIEAFVQVMMFCTYVDRVNDLPAAFANWGVSAFVLVKMLLVIVASIWMAAAMVERNPEGGNPEKAVSPAALILIRAVVGFVGWTVIVSFVPTYVFVPGYEIACVTKFMLLALAFFCLSNACKEQQLIGGIE